MLIYTNNNNTFCFIHIPKNSGKYVRKIIKEDKQNTIIKEFWGLGKQIDMAHIPYMLSHEYISPLNLTNIQYYTYVRNPYNRIISAFLYKNKGSNMNKFKLFIKNTLLTYNFDETFNKNIIHYYPQYMFICAKDLTNTNVTIKKLEEQPDFKINEYDFSKYLDDTIVKIINDVYNVDFKMFGYEMISV